MAEVMIECVIAADCMGDGEIYLRGETRTVPKSVYRSLVVARRVCVDDAEAEAARSELAGRLQEAGLPAPETKPSKSKGNA